MLRIFGGSQGLWEEVDSRISRKSKDHARDEGDEMPIRVGVAGATGWTGSLLTKTILSSKEFELTGAIARKHAGEDIGIRLGIGKVGVPIAVDLKAALERTIDVLVDYTSASSVKERTLEAIHRGLRVVIGTSGLTVDDYAEIDEAARSSGVSVIAAGNFSITAALAKHFSLFAAQHISSWEIIDYASANKIDAPSGTTRELAEEMAAIATNHIEVPIDQTHGCPEARGALIGETPVHSIRLPGYVIAFETIFGLPEERLTIRHDAGSGALPYVAGTLLAVRKVMTTLGLIRGLDRLLFQQGHEL
jgi:4-hydroxy-tetrahydrodipicolinate reductase